MMSPLDVMIWEEFCTLVKGGVFPASKIRPYWESLTEPLIQILSKMNCQGFFELCGSPVDVHQVENQVHFLVLDGSPGNPETLCFSFVLDKSNWYFQHLESITIRLDKIGDLPVSNYPDLPEKQKAWMRQEFQVTEMVRLYKFLCEEKGTEFALAWFKDGAGYALAARSWVSFVSPHRAFILYLCWEQTNLFGNPVTLIVLDDKSAQVVLDSHYFQLYDRTAHLRQQIDFSDYRRIFEIIWEDRAAQAGWEVIIKYVGSLCHLEFTRLI